MDCLALQPTDEAVSTFGLDRPDPPCPSPKAVAPAAVFVECVGATQLEHYRVAWADLARRTLDPNVFLSPAFALPLFQHLASRRGLRILFVWEEGGPTFFGRLLGLFPLEMPGGLRSFSCARVFAHEQTACGTPLVDGTRADAVFEAVVTWLEAHETSADALVLSGIARDGAFAAALRRFAGETSRPIAILDAWERAVLPGRGEMDGRVASFASAKRRKERARQARRLSETGIRSYVSARTPDEIAVATERFLVLEDRGWKGSRDTSLLAAPSRATFARTMMRLMAQEGRCRIDSIEIDGNPVAMGIVLTEGDRAYFWKTAFNEAYATFSPGVQLTLELTRTQLADASVTLTDSCAVAKHPMIDRLWPDRMAAEDVFLAVRRGGGPRFERSLRLERWRLGARRHLKAAWKRLRNLRGD